MSHGFTSADHRAAVFASDPALGQAIANKYGAKIGGGFTQKQLADRATASALGHPYTPPRAAATPHVP